jgi:hypothetical protein
VFLDDILIYSKTLAEHESHLRAALDRLRAQGLHAKISKCSFFRQEVEFLGHYVGHAGVRMVEGKVEAVRAWPTPTKQKDVEQFIGLAGYYRRFIANFSKIASPLTELCGTLKKARGGTQKRDPPKKEFKWGEEQQRAFEHLKEAVSGAPCLAMPDPAREFIVHRRVGVRNGGGADAAIRRRTAAHRVSLQEDEAGRAKLPDLRAGTAGDSQRAARVAPLPGRAPFHRVDGPPVAAVRGGLGDGHSAPGALGDVAERI